MLTAEAKRRALQALFGGGLLVGLATPQGEVTDPAYRRMPVRFGPPRPDADGTVIVTNAERVVFPPFAEDAPLDVSHWFLVDADGVELERSPLDAPRRPRKGEEAIIGRGALIIGLS